MVVSLATVRVPQWFMAFRVDEPLDAHTPAKAMEIGAMVIGGIMAIIGTIIGIGTPVLSESVFTISATHTITMIRTTIRSRTMMTMDNTESRRMYRLRLPGADIIGE